MSSQRVLQKLLQEVKEGGLRLRHIDAKGWVVGRLAAQIAMILQGKDKPTYVPYLPEGDVVVVTNTMHVDFTGWKWRDKLYKWHTGYPGGLKERSARDEHLRDPTAVLQRAVYGMLPKHNLRKVYNRRLRLYPNEHHDFEGHPQLVPWVARHRHRHSWPRVASLDPWQPGFEPVNLEAFEQNVAKPLLQHNMRMAEALERRVRMQRYREWAVENGEFL